MSDNRRTNRKLFTIEQANATLPLVRAITEDLQRLSLDVSERRERLSHLQSGRDSESQDPYSEELAEIEAELEQDTARLTDYVDELEQLGVEPKNGSLGLIDFPAEIDGRQVYLCWKLGESELLCWHELDAGFAGRQPLTAGSFAGNGESALDDSDSLDS